MKLEAIKIHRVAFKIRPSPAHPLYWKIEFGLLVVYLLDTAWDLAVKRAESIVENLPYEVVLEDRGSIRILPEHEERDREISALASSYGVAFHMIAAGTGETDYESEFMRAFLPQPAL